MTLNEILNKKGQTSLHDKLLEKTVERAGTLTTSGVYDTGTVNGAEADATSTKTGTSTPSVSGDVFVTGVGLRTSFTTLTIDSGFTKDQTFSFAGAANFGSAYLISTDSLLKNPLWASDEGSTGIGATIAAFKPVTTAATPPTLATIMGAKVMGMTIQ